MLRTLLVPLKGKRFGLELRPPLGHSVSGMQQIATGISIQQRSIVKIVLSIGDGISPLSRRIQGLQSNALRDADPFLLCKDFILTLTLISGPRHLFQICAEQNTPLRRQTGKQPLPYRLPLTFLHLPVAMSPLNGVVIITHCCPRVIRF